MDSWIHNGAFYVPQPGFWQLGDGIVWRAEFGALPVSTTTNGSANTSAIAAMPLVFARASSATAQTSESSLVISGVATDVPAIGEVGTGVGLLHEPANTNDILHSSDVSQSAWIKGTGVTATANTSDVTDPAGGNAASKVVYDGSGVANATRFAQSATIAVGEVVSLWARVASGTADIRVGTNVEYGTAATLTTTWQRISFEATAAATGIYVYGANGSNAAFTIYVYGAQHDSRRFASSTTLTTTTSVTRAMTRLYKASEAVLQTTNGTYNSIRLEFRFTALEAVSAMTADRFLFYTANSDYMYIAATTHEVAVRDDEQSELHHERDRLLLRHGRRQREPARRGHPLHPRVRVRQGALMGSMTRRTSGRTIHVRNADRGAAAHQALPRDAADAGAH